MLWDMKDCDVKPGTWMQKQMDVWWIPSTSQSRAKSITALCLLCFYASLCEMRRDYS